MIEAAAFELILEHGYDDVTVGMICDASMVSPRTFFNYFGSKEVVVLGAAPATPSAVDIEKFVTADNANIVADFVVLITAEFLDQRPNPELFAARRLLIQRTPALFERQLARMTQTEKQLVQIVTQRFRLHGRDTGTNPDLDDEARMVVALGMGVMRFVMHKRIIEKFPGSSRELMNGAVALIEQITSNKTTTSTQKATDV
ncbi:MAG: TetR/AcrR family transcriptional regulator [Lacisediminihabitans sp.]